MENERKGSVEGDSPDSQLECGCGNTIECLRASLESSRDRESVLTNKVDRLTGLVLEMKRTLDDLYWVVSKNSGQNSTIAGKAAKQKRAKQTADVSAQLNTVEQRTVNGQFVQPASTQTASCQLASNRSGEAATQEDDAASCTNVKRTTCPRTPETDEEILVVDDEPSAFRFSSGTGRENGSSNYARDDTSTCASGLPPVDEDDDSWQTIHLHPCVCGAQSDKKSVHREPKDGCVQGWSFEVDHWSLQVSWCPSAGI